MTAVAMRYAFRLMGFSADQANELCLLLLWTQRGLIGGPHDTGGQL